MKRIVLHIGTGKTGTSAIQSYLHQCRAALLAQGVDYPEHGLSVVDHFGEPIAAHYPLCDWLLRGLDERLTRWQLALSKSSAGTLILSCENFYHRLEPDHINDLRRRLNGFDVQVLCYVRPQDSFMASAWKQQVKVGDMRLPFPTFLERHCSPDFLTQSHANYHRMLAPWAAAFGRSAVRLRVFDRDLLAQGGGLLQDFLAACELGLHVADLGEPASTRNEALPSELLLLLRHANWRKAVPAADQASFVQFLRQFRFDDPPLLSAAERADVLRNYLPSNEALFQEFGGGDVPACFLPAGPEAADDHAVARLPRVEDIAIGCLVQAWENAGSPPVASAPPPSPRDHEAPAAPRLAAWKKWLRPGPR